MIKVIILNKPFSQHKKELKLVKELQSEIKFLSYQKPKDIEISILYN